MSTNIKTSMSFRWWLIYALLGVFLTAIYVVGALNWTELSSFLLCSSVVIGAFFIIGFPEALSRRYEFGPAIIRYRFLFRWREVPVPAAVAFLDTEGAISIRDATTGKEILEINREYTKGGSLLQELSDFYLEYDREVVIL